MTPLLRLRMPKAPFTLVKHPPLTRLPPYFFDALAVIGMNGVSPAKIPIFLPALAGVIGPGRLRRHKGSGGIRYPRHIGNDRDQQTVPLLTAAERILGLLALGK